MAQGMELARQVFDELRAIKYGDPYLPTKDVNLVWSLSAPGTVLEAAPIENPVYGGQKPDLLVASHAIEVIKAVTATRLDMEPCEVTRSNIRENGPRLYYNGEDEETEGVNYPQNQDFLRWVRNPSGPIPAISVKVDKIDRISTPAQVEGIINYIKETGLTGKVAVVSMVPHSCRVGRYIQKQRKDIPQDVEFVNAPAPITTRTFAKVRSEVTKIVTYAAKGDLAEENYFFTKH